MTPTEQDKNVVGTLYTPVNNQKLTASALADVLSVDITQLITADRERVALEARIDELTKALQSHRLDEYGLAYIEERHAELKQELEKL